MSIAAVQARMVELQSAITAVTRDPAPATSTPTRQGDFDDALATAVAGQSALAALTGTSGGAWPAAAAGQAGAGGFGAAGAGGFGAVTAGAMPGGLFGPLAGSAGVMTGGMFGALAGPGALGGALGALAPLAPATSVTGAPGITGPGGPPAPGTGAAFVESARKYLGVPYVWGGESLSEGGLDCSGLVQLAMKDIGVDVPRVVRQQMTIGTEVPSLDQALPGDLVVTRGGGHIGIYVGDNKWIHAPYPGEKVKLAEMTSTPTTIRRVLPPW